MRTLDINETWAIMAELPFKKPPRKMKTRDDWGDQETVGVHLKRVGTQFHGAKEDDFGRFFGAFQEGFLVGIKNWESHIVSGELFENLEELKQRWEVD